jgi:hypothetical protein
MRFRSVVALVLLGLSGTVGAHGGVSMEDDTCVMRIDPFRAHFTGYQPELRATQEFCEDIPELGKAIIVVDFIHNELRSRQVEFRVLRDVRGLGMGAHFEDLGDAAAIDAATLFRMEPQVYPKGTLTFEQRFDTSGWFIGMLSATDPATGQTLHSVFPFQVGVRHPWRLLPWFALAIGLSFLVYRLTGRGLKKPAGT